MRKRKTKTATKYGWTDINKQHKKGQRLFKYSKQEICQNCGLYIEPKKRFCNMTCKDQYYDKLLTKIVEVTR